eukprot:tig00000319_g24141.t1
MPAAGPLSDEELDMRLRAHTRRFLEEAVMLEERLAQATSERRQTGPAGVRLEIAELERELAQKDALLLKYSAKIRAWMQEWQDICVGADSVLNPAKPAQSQPLPSPQALAATAATFSGTVDGDEPEAKKMRIEGT